jgi:transposase InsO family protein
LLLQGEEDA